MLKVKFLMGPTDCNDRNIPAYSEKYLADLSSALGEEVISAPMEEVAAQPLPVYFIASGGAEPGFKLNCTSTAAPYILLTTPSYNSLAAAMEIMGFLTEHGQKGEIVHGSFEDCASRLKVLMRAASAKQVLGKMKLGAFGEPGGLIASDIDSLELKKACGATFQLIPLQEVVEEYEKGGYESNDYTEAIKNKNYKPEEVEKALNIYGALKRLIAKYSLNAITVKCFDLLGLLHSTGCLALAILNAEGIPAACEGDQKGLVSMAVLHAVTGGSSFMANPCYIDEKTKEIIFAHCTIAIDMPDSYYLTTHFESGIGVAISGDIAPQEMTVFKCDGSLKHYYAGRANLVDTSHRMDLCRTQMRLSMVDGTEYFLKHPISNHHMICKGDWKDEIDELFKMLTDNNK